jgi:16S rRNA (guanine527-N7)-methyltransferase
VRAELGLANLHAHHARVELLQAPRDLPPATLIVSRAFSSLAQFVALTAHLRAPQGVWAAMKGQWPDEELAALPDTVRAGPAFTLRVPRLDAQRHLLLIEPA